MTDSTNDPAPPAPEGNAGDEWWPATNHGAAGGPSRQRPPMSRQRMVLMVVGGLVALGVAAGVARTALGDDGDDAAATGGADGAPSGFGGPGAPDGFGGTAGAITAVDGSTVTLDADGESVEVATSDETTVSDTSEGSLDDIAEGDTVLVLGEADDDGTVAATAVVAGADLGGLGGPGGDRPDGAAPPDGAPSPDELPEGAPPAGEAPEGAPGQGGGQGGGPGNMVSGTVESIDGSTLVVVPDDGDAVTAEVSDDTTIQVVTTLSVSDLAKGDEVTVTGETGDDGTVTARSIQRGTGGFGGFGGFGRGGPQADGADTDSTGEA